MAGNGVLPPSTAAGMTEGVTDVVRRLAVNLQTVGDGRELVSLCLSLARGIDFALANKDDLVSVQGFQDLPRLLTQLCECRRDVCVQPAIMVLMISVKNACAIGWFPEDSEALLNIANEIINTVCFQGFVNNRCNDSSSMLLTVMSRFLPLMKMGEILSSLEIKPGYEAYMMDFHLSKNAGQSPQENIRLFVVQTDNIDTSACLISPQKVSFLLNGQGLEKRSNVSMETGPQLPTDVTGMLKCGTNTVQAVGQFDGHYIIVIAFVSMMPLSETPMLEDYVQPGVPTLAPESEMIEGPSRISLDCPISRNRIRTPVKGKSCKHYQCFDFRSYVEINSKRPSWHCPDCNQSCCYIDLRFDQNIVKVLQEVGADVNDVLLSFDGSWKAVFESDKILEQSLERPLSKGQPEQQEARTATAAQDVLDLTEGDDKMNCVVCSDIEDRKPLPNTLQSQAPADSTAASPWTNADDVLQYAVSQPVPDRQQLPRSNWDQAREQVPSQTIQQVGVGVATSVPENHQAGFVSVSPRAIQTARPPPFLAVQTASAADLYTMNASRIRDLTTKKRGGVGGAVPEAPQSDGSANPPSEKNWRPTSQMRGSVSERDFETLKDMVIQPTQRSQVPRPPPHLIPSSLRPSAPPHLQGSLRPCAPPHLQAFVSRRTTQVPRPPSSSATEPSHSAIMAEPRPRDLIDSPMPKYDDLLRLNDVPRAMEIWKYEVQMESGQTVTNSSMGNLLRIRRSHLVHEDMESTNESFNAYMRMTGFWSIWKLSCHRVDQAFITALTERWRPETHTFHLAEGEMTITLEDVEVLTGLPVDGAPVTGPGFFADYSNWCIQYLGLNPNDWEGSMVGNRLNLFWLKTHFPLSKLASDADDITVQRYVRATLLQLIGGHILADKSGYRTAMRYMPFLTDLTQVSSYSWGSACLAWLYRQLCYATLDINCTELAGFLPLLDFWSFERLSIGRPNRIPQLPETPIGFSWLNCKRRRSEKSLRALRRHLDLLRSDQIIWEPYKGRMSGKDIWRARVPMICHNIVEWHYPNRVKRQFGLSQEIPESNSVDINEQNELHTVTVRGKINVDWSERFASHVDAWNHRYSFVISGQPMIQPSVYHSHYLEWYRERAIRFLTIDGAARIRGIDVVEYIRLLHLPNATPIDERSFSCMERISPDLQNLDEMRNIARPVDVPDHGLYYGLILTRKLMDGVRMTGVFLIRLKPKKVTEFLQKHDLDITCSAHQVVEDRWLWVFHKRQPVMIFSAPIYYGKFDNVGALMSVDDYLTCPFPQVLRCERKGWIWNQQVKTRHTTSQGEELIRSTIIANH